MSADVSGCFCLDPRGTSYCYIGVAEVIISGRVRVRELKCYNCFTAGFSLLKEKGPGAIVF
jgi:hypothetical protein